MSVNKSSSSHPHDRWGDVNPADNCPCRRCTQKNSKVPEDTDITGQLEEYPIAA